MYTFTGYLSLPETNYIIQRLSVLTAHVCNVLESQFD